MIEIDERAFEIARNEWLQNGVFKNAIRAYLAALQPPAPTGETVTVRVAVAVDTNGCWQAAGANFWPDGQAFIEARADNNDARYILTATLPIPTVPEIAAQVERQS
jgi:hypothetical protein